MRVIFAVFYNYANVNLEYYQQTFLKVQKFTITEDGTIITLSRFLFLKHLQYNFYLLFFIIIYFFVNFLCYNIRIKVSYLFFLYITPYFSFFIQYIKNKYMCVHINQILQLLLMLTLIPVSFSSFHSVFLRNH